MRDWKRDGWVMLRWMLCVSFIELVWLTIVWAVHICVYVEDGLIRTTAHN
jgi:hypothetical protein